MIFGQKRDDIAVPLFHQYGEEVVFFEFEMALQIATQNRRQLAQKRDALCHSQTIGIVVEEERTQAFKQALHVHVLVMQKSINLPIHVHNHLPEKPLGMTSGPVWRSYSKALAQCLWIDKLNPTPDQTDAQGPELRKGARQAFG